MLRTFIALAALTACADAVDVHQIGECDPAWGTTTGTQPERCELACSTYPPPPAERGPGCMTADCATGDGRTCAVPRCVDSFDWRGHEGCCTLGGVNLTLVQFYECP
jgi:hypothetical protein